MMIVGRHLRCVAAISLFGVVSVSGCSRYEPSATLEDTADAAGTLTYQGEPLAFYEVVVYPPDHRPASGITDENGKFVLGTNGPGDGAVVGIHPVAVKFVGPPSDVEPGREEFGPPPTPTVALPDKYASPETSGVTVEIPESGDEDLKIDLQ